MTFSAWLKQSAINAWHVALISVAACITYAAVRVAVSVGSGDPSAEALRRQAVEHGVAEWVTDVDGRATFQWKAAR